MGTRSYLMAPFLDFILFNTHTIHSSYDDMLYDSTKVTEATVVFQQIATAKILEALYAKRMRIFSIGSDGLLSQRAAFSDDQELECLTIDRLAQSHFSIWNIFSMSTTPAI
jgi:hypothetical protein